MTGKDWAELRLSGQGISPGEALGKAFVYRDILYRDQESFEIAEAEIEDENGRFEEALQEVIKDLRQAADGTHAQTEGKLADIFQTHEVMLSDPVLREEVRGEIEAERVTAEQAVKRVFRRWERRFLAMEDGQFAHLGHDVADLARRILRSLAGLDAHTLENMPAGSILVARRLLPSDTVFLNRKSTAGVVVELGGPLSHAAILTRGLGVPAVSRVPDVLNTIASTDRLLVDGTNGFVVLHPDDETRDRATVAIAKQRTDRAIMRDRALRPAETRDGVEVKALANVGGAEDAKQAISNGADGIGLYRIEHMYLSRQSPPSEADLSARLERSLQAVRGKPVTVRLLDAGGDKELPFVKLPTGPNPFLGRRGVRLLFDYPELLQTQLRALLRLSEGRQIQILVPMVTLAREMIRIRELLEAAAEEVGVQRLPPLGAMVETPAAALCAAEIAEHADFLSIGTNDLTQYTMAAGRENPYVSNYFIDDHPALRRLLQTAVDGAGDVPVSICGELAGRKEGVRMAVECGIRTLSVAPPLIPDVKEMVRELKT